MIIKTLTNHLVLGKKLIRFDSIVEIKNDGLLLKDNSIIKLNKSELLKVLIEMNKNKKVDLI